MNQYKLVFISDDIEDPELTSQVNLGSNGLFTLHGNRTETGSGNRTSGPRVLIHTTREQDRDRYREQDLESSGTNSHDTGTGPGQVQGTGPRVLGY